MTLVLALSLSLAKQHHAQRPRCRQRHRVEFIANNINNNI
jgi:hypothetical protein